MPAVPDGLGSQRHSVFCDIRGGVCSGAWDCCQFAVAVAGIICTADGKFTLAWQAKALGGPGGKFAEAGRGEEAGGAFNDATPETGGGLAA
mmetsp:Transcript_29468/g.53499  ORF Transcript_29468/g.53499 Transcript_29468/m.53499 type:complete len:91 (-) Transcript_29468:20-292(-)